MPWNGMGGQQTWTGQQQPPQMGMGGGTGAAPPGTPEAGPQGGAGGATGGTNPLQPVYAPNPTMSNVNLDPNSTIQQILQGFAPQAQNAQQGFMDTMALSGLSGAPVAAGENQLQSALAAGLSPALANAIMGSQGMSLQQSLANQGAWNQNNMFNATEGTNAGDQLAQMLYGGWGQQLGATSGILGMGQQGGSNIAQGAQGNYGVQQGPDLAALMQSFGSTYQPTQTLGQAGYDSSPIY